MQRVVFIIRRNPRGSPKVPSTKNGKHTRKIRFCAFLGNVRSSLHFSSFGVKTPCYHSWVREERSLVSHPFIRYCLNLIPSPSSTIIQDIDELRKTGLASLAYYYFDFKDSGKQDRRGLLSSLLVQLSARSDASCKILDQLYLAHDKGLRQPSESDLVRCLKEVLAIRQQSDIFIIIDALDECPNNYGMPTPREYILELLEELVSSRPHVHICVTSRPEVDIQLVLEPLKPNRVSLHDVGGQRQDMIQYVKSVVESDPKTRRWGEEDKQLVINTLARKADGM